MTEGDYNPEDQNTVVLLLPSDLRLQEDPTDSTIDDAFRRVAGVLYDESEIELLSLDHPWMPKILVSCLARAAMMSFDPRAEVPKMPEVSPEDPTTFTCTMMGKEKRLTIRAFVRTPSSRPRVVFLDYEKPETHGLVRTEKGAP